MSEADARVGVVRDATERLLEQNDRANHTKNRLIAAVAIVLIALLASFGVVTVVDQVSVNSRLLHASQLREQQNAAITRILGDVQQTVDPQSALARRNSTTVQQLVVHIELCIYRHEDQIAARSEGKPVPPNLADCPAEPRG